MKIEIVYASEKYFQSFYEALSQVAKERIYIKMAELHVYSSNVSAKALYKKFGFEQEGLLKEYRKLDGQDFDCLAMAKFFNKE